jgi:hypothetical protein
MTETHSKESMLSPQVNLTEEERERRKRKLMVEWQKLENSKIAHTDLDDFIESETRSIGRRLESQTEHYSPKCVTCGGVGRHLRIECGGVNWTRVVQAS